MDSKGQDKATARPWYACEPQRPDGSDGWSIHNGDDAGDPAQCMTVAHGLTEADARLIVAAVEPIHDSFRRLAVAERDALQAECARLRADNAALREILNLVEPMVSGKLGAIVRRAALARSGDAAERQVGT